MEAGQANSSLGKIRGQTRQMKAIVPLKNSVYAVVHSSLSMKNFPLARSKTQ